MNHYTLYLGGGLAAEVNTIKLLEYTKLLMRPLFKLTLYLTMNQHFLSEQIEPKTKMNLDYDSKR